MFSAGLGAAGWAAAGNSLFFPAPSEGGLSFGDSSFNQEEFHPSVPLRGGVCAPFSVGTEPLWRGLQWAALRRAFDPRGSFRRAGPHAADGQADRQGRSGALDWEPAGRASARGTLP